MHDAATFDGLVIALYEVISGDPGVRRDWSRFRALFYPGARMISSWRDPSTGKTGPRSLTPDEYIASSGSYLEDRGFHEIELARVTQEYGSIAHVLSAYEARHRLSDPDPLLRGINSIQLLNGGDRWWILSVAWSQETPDTPLPEKYLAAPSSSC